MRVVIDTNVLVSAALKDRDPEAVLLYVASSSEIEWIVSTEILAEYKEVLGREKFALPKVLQLQWFAMLDSVTRCIEAENEVSFPRDPGDAKFIACALAADAEFLISGDRDFREARRLSRTVLISVSLFKKLVVDAGAPPAEP